MVAPRSCSTRLSGSTLLEDDNGPGFTAIVDSTQSTSQQYTVKDNVHTWAHTYTYMLYIGFF
jgi:hypothetical protein